MIERWAQLLSGDEIAALHSAGYVADGAATWGRGRLGRKPALIVIDVQRNMIGPELPLVEAVNEYRTAIGATAHAALPHVLTVIDIARRAALPIVFTRLVPSDGQPMTEDSALIPALEPRSNELVLIKHFASAFAGTALQMELCRREVDSVVLVGATTSGCVRATAVDAIQQGFAPVVVPEATCDRLAISHEVALLDLWLKYASLLSPRELADSLRDRSHAE